MQNDLKKPNSNNLFIVSATIVLLLFTTIFYFHSINKRKAEYGDKWKQSVYTVNPFQIDMASDIQKSIHEWNVSRGMTGTEGAIIEAMTIGYKTELTKEIKDDFSRAGVRHILALSGFHISILYVILEMIFLIRISKHKWRKRLPILIVIILWLYAFIAGMSPSLVRAVIMCTIFTIGKLHTDKLLSFRVLFISAIVMLLYEPLLIFHVGFQLSYLSMIGILLIGVPLCHLYNGYTIIDRFVWCTLSISLTCSLFTLPLVAYTFGNIPLLGLFTNIIVTTLTYILYFLFALYLVSFGSVAISNCMLDIAHYMLLVVKHVSHLPYSVFEWHPSFPTVMLTYSLVGIITVILRRSLMTTLKK